MVDWVSFSVAVVATVVALLGWWEARRHSELLQSMSKSLAFIARSRRSKGKGKTAGSTAISLQQQAEERRRLKLELEREKEQWRRQKDIAKAIGWVLDRIGSDEEDEYEE
jgi:hypothetical protein